MRMIASSTPARRQGATPLKLDYCDASVGFGSEDPADLSETTRGLTIMLAEDWRDGLLLTDFRGVFSKTTLSFFF
jgi:hypothetical protein